jgi:hypothetical protein
MTNVKILFSRCRDVVIIQKSQCRRAGDRCSVGLRAGVDVLLLSAEPEGGYCRGAVEGVESSTCVMAEADFGI